MDWNATLAESKLTKNITHCRIESALEKANAEAIGSQLAKAIGPALAHGEQGAEDVHHGDGPLHRKGGEEIDERNHAQHGAEGVDGLQLDQLVAKEALVLLHAGDVGVAEVDAVDGLDGVGQEHVRDQDDVELGDELALPGRVVLRVPPQLRLGLVRRRARLVGPVRLLGAYRRHARSAGWHPFCMPLGMQQDDVMSRAKDAIRNHGVPEAAFRYSWQQQRRESRVNKANPPVCGCAAGMAAGSRGGVHNTEKAKSGL